MLNRAESAVCRAVVNSVYVLRGCSEKGAGGRMGRLHSNGRVCEFAVVKPDYFVRVGSYGRT